MTNLKLHYDGWLSLPESLRQQLGMKTGDRLDVELVDGAIVLRLAGKAQGDVSQQNGHADHNAYAAAPATLVPVENTIPVKRKRGRPRKERATDELELVPQAKRPRGRPRKTVAAPAPEPVPSEPWKLRKKADLQPPGPDWTAQRPLTPVRRDSGFQPEERRPFRNVEVRKLGPGRGHNQSRFTAASVNGLSKS